MELLNQDINGCYKITEKLSETDVYTSWKAIGLYSPLIFNLKFLNKKDKDFKLEEIARFEKQILGIYKLNHPNIKRIFEIDKYNDYRYISLEFVEGITLEQYLSDNHKLSYKESLNIIYEICKGIEAAHRNGVIHKAINPANIFLEINNNKINKIKIANFGFSELNFYNKKLNSSELKNAYYIAPEGFGYFNKTMDERADLYSLGLIFYRLLLGEQFMQSADIDDIIRKVISIDLSVPLITLKDKIPPIVIDVIKKLIGKNPEDRYKSAIGLLTDIERLKNKEDNFELGIEDETFNPTFDSPIINFAKEMQILLKLSDLTKNGKGQTCIVFGEHGFGKTKLIEEFSNSILIKNGYFLDGSFFSCSSKYSFYAFNKSIEKFVYYYQKLNGDKQNKIRDSITKIINSENNFIVKIFPCLSSICDIQPPNTDKNGTIADPEYMNKTALFICELSKIAGFMVILLDNIHWIDSDSFNLFKEINKIIDKYPLFLIGTCIQSELLKIPDEITSNFTNEKITKLYITAMDKKNIIGLVKNILGQNCSKINNNIFNYIYNSGEGNPFNAIEILKNLIDEEVIYPVIDQWESSMERFEKTSGYDISTLLIKKIKTLRNEEFEILTIIAIIDIDIKMDMLFKLCHYYFEDILTIVDDLLSRKILNQRISSAGNYLYLNEIVKSILRENLYEGKAKNLIIDIANLLETDVIHENTASRELQDKLYITAKGFSKLNNSEKSVIYSYRFGLVMKENYGFYEAKKYFEHAVELMENFNEKDDKLYSDIKKSLDEILKYIPDTADK